MSQISRKFDPFRSNYILHSGKDCVYLSVLINPRRHGLSSRSVCMSVCLAVSVYTEAIALHVFIPWIAPTQQGSSFKFGRFLC